MNLSPKYGGRPEFSPQFVLSVLESLKYEGGHLDYATLRSFIVPADENDFLDDLKFGNSLGLYSYNGEELSLNKGTEFLEAVTTPFLFSQYLTKAVTSLDPIENWNSLNGLLAWAYSVSPIEITGNSRRGRFLATSWGGFEPLATSTGLHGKDRVFLNQEQYVATRRWADALGVYSYVEKDIHAFCYEQVILETFNLLTAQKVPIREFITRMRTAMPYLPGGIMNLNWIGSLPQGVDMGAIDMPEPNFLSLIEGIVVQFLESKNLLHLNYVKDSPDQMTLNNGVDGGRSISHVQGTNLTEGGLKI